MENNILLELALIILLAKILGALSRKIKQPPVIGLLLLGVLLGPTVLDLIKPSEIIVWVGKIGVLLLLFEAGLETDLKRIKNDSRLAFPAALGGVIIPFVCGFLLTYLTYADLIQGLITGVIFTATSVSVSIMTLLDLGKFKGMEGRCIVNAAIIDDIIGILLLTFIFGLTTNIGSGSSPLVLSGLKILMFFTVIFLIGIFLIKPFFHNLKKLLLENAVIALVIVVLFIYSWLAEYAGLAAITGAYFAGLFIGQTEHKTKVYEGISIMGKSIFVDVFFVGLGLEFDLFRIDADPIYLILFILLAVAGKMLGSGLGARLVNFDLIRSFRIGSGMIPRGEVALIVANMALQNDLISRDIISATIMMVIFSAIITPLLLKLGFSGIKRKSFERSE